MKTFEEWIDFRDPVNDHSMLNRVSSYELYQLEIINCSYTEYITLDYYREIHNILTNWNYEIFKKQV